MQTSLLTSRLLLRPYALEDAAQVRCLAGERAVAEPTAAIPYPYPEGAAEEGIRGHAELFEAREGVSFATTNRQSGELIGTVSLLEVSPRHARAEIGYWVGLPFWGSGFCTEAAIALMEFGETHFQLSRFVGRCYASNTGSARVMEKAGLALEGRQMQHARYGAGFEDMLLYGRNLKGRDA